MRESIGSVSLLNFVIFFILLVFAFLMGTFSYYKAYKVNNYLVAAIEKYEGFNALAAEEIDEKLSSLSYSRIDFNCDSDGQNGYYLINPITEVNKTNRINDSQKVNQVNGKNIGYKGYCVYAKSWDSRISSNNSNSNGGYNHKDRYDSYKVTTVINFNFPILGAVLKMRVSSKTDRIYNYECASASNCNCNPGKLGDSCSN